MVMIAGLLLILLAAGLGAVALRPKAALAEPSPHHRPAPHRRDAPGSVSSAGRLTLMGLLLVAFAIGLVGGCGGDEDETHDTGTSVDDETMQSNTDFCVGDWMRQAAATPEVDLATGGELEGASLTVLNDCGNAAIERDKVRQGYQCTGGGCYDVENKGYAWTTMALHWACRDRPEWFDPSVC